MRTNYKVITPRRAGYTVTGVFLVKKFVPLWQMIGFVFTGVIGTLLHFLFDWTAGNTIAAIFSGVNESIWEHTKLLFYPMAVFAVIEYLAWGREMPSFWCIKLIGILSGLILIPVIYYTYTGVLGRKVDWFNIVIFFLASATGYYMESKLFQKNTSCRLPDWGFLGIVCLLAVSYTVLTFHPIRIPLFQDSNTGEYGFFKAAANNEYENKTSLRIAQGGFCRKMDLQL